MANRNHLHAFLRKLRPLALAGLVMLLGACRPAAKGGLPTCSAVALGLAETISPGGPEAEWGVLIDSLSPTLTWSFSDPACDPEYFELDLQTAWTSPTGPSPLGEHRIPGSYRLWVPPDPLETGTTYYWNIRAGVGDVMTDVDWGIFRTGPECVVISPGTMSAPILLYPPDGSVLGDLNPLLEWNDPTTCIPPGDYEVQISSTPTFASAGVLRNSLPYVGIALPWSDTPLEDCRTYYWRVKIDLRDRIDSEDGPWSETWSFTTRAGVCGTLPETHITPIPRMDFPEIAGDTSSWISGMVWHDLCALPYESTDVAPPGCVFVSEEDGYWANGTLDPGEPGLAGVTVELGAGACPTVGLATTVTRSDGHYSFGPLAAGTYCVSVNSLSDANMSILIPGSWTYPIRFADPAMQTVTLGASEVQSDKNFGWDFQFLPSPSGGTPVAKLLRNAYCRSGPAIEYRSLTTLFQGLEVPIDGRNQDSSWWWVRIPNSLDHCWLAKENAETSGDTSKVPVVEAEPLGCWVWTGNQNECKSPCPEGAQPGGVCEP